MVDATLISLIGVIVALTVLLAQQTFFYPKEQIKEFISLYDVSLSDLKKAEDAGKINKKQHNEAANKINEHYNKFNENYKKLLKRAKLAKKLKFFLPIFLTIEILHITLQEFQWSELYEWIFPMLNKLYVVFIIIVPMLVLFIITPILSETLTEHKIKVLKSDIESVIGEYIFDMK